MDLDDSNPAYRLSVKYFDQCLDLGRPLNEKEFQEFVSHPNYCPEFEKIVEDLKSAFAHYETAVLRQLPEVMEGESTEDMIQMLGFANDDFADANISGSDPQEVKERGIEAAVRLISLAKYLEDKT